MVAAGQKIIIHLDDFMNSFRKIFNELELNIKNNNPNNFKIVWIDYIGGDSVISKYYDARQEKQSLILETICIKNNLKYHIYNSNIYLNDKERLEQYYNFLKWKSENYDTILCSKVLKEQLYFGEYKKYSFDQLDLFPFKDLTDSQLSGIIENVLRENNIVSLPVKSKLEWLYNQDQRFNIIFSNQDPTKNIMWGTYSIEEKELIANYYALVRSRQHKILKKI